MKLFTLVIQSPLRAKNLMYKFTRILKSTTIPGLYQYAQALFTFIRFRKIRVVFNIQQELNACRPHHQGNHSRIVFVFLILISCSPYDPSPSTERAIYPTECDGSPIELGYLKIYDTDSTFLTSIDIDHQYVPTGTYYIDLTSGTYIFKLHSDFTNQTAFFNIAIHLKTQNIDLNICDGD